MQLWVFMHGGAQKTYSHVRAHTSQQVLACGLGFRKSSLEAHDFSAVREVNFFKPITSMICFICIEIILKQACTHRGLIFCRKICAHQNNRGGGGIRK